MQGTGFDPWSGNSDVTDLRTTKLQAATTEPKSHRKTGALQRRPNSVKQTLKEKKKKDTSIMSGVTIKKTRFYTMFATFL